MCWDVFQLDGWIARTYKNQSTKLGSFLDPMADKVLIATLFLSLTYVELIPSKFKNQGNICGKVEPFTTLVDIVTSFLSPSFAINVHFSLLFFTLVILPLVD